jgi:hypothetical protein
VLYGFGFAEALVEIGLPQTDIPLALLSFHAGVEVGQLAFAVAMLLAWRLACLLISIPVPQACLAASYGIGYHAYSGEPNDEAGRGMGVDTNQCLEIPRSY